MHLGIIVRQQVRNWRTSLAFVTVIALAVTVAGTWLAVALPLLRNALPFPDPPSLVAIETFAHGQRGGVTWQGLEDLRVDSIEHIAAFSPRTWGLQTETGGHVEVVLSQQVTGEFFEALQVKVALGEPLTRQHEQTGNQNWVWFSHQSWKRFLNGSADSVNRIVWINAVPYRVAGILPEWFDFPHQGQSPDIYIPLNRTDYASARGAGGLGGIARLKPGVTMKRFQSELDARSAALASQFAATSRDVRFVAVDVSAFLLGDRLRLLRWLMASVLILLLVALTNSSGIWLAQWLRQQRLVSIQMCLGASARQILFDQVTQALVLGIAASTVGLLGVETLLRVLRSSSLFGVELSRFEIWSKAQLDPWTIACLIILTLATSLLSVLLPSITLRGGWMQSLVLGGGRTATGRSSRRLRIALAVAQLTLTGTLAYAGILIGRNVQNLVQADRGFRTEQILVSGIGISEAKYNTDEKMIRFHQRVIEELKQIPGVIDAAGGVSMPLSQARTRFMLDGETTPRDQQRTARFGVVSPSLLPMLAIPLQRGRLFDTTDQWHSPKVALVNQAFADRYLSDAADVLGHGLRFSFYNGFAAKPYTEYKVIGVIGNTLNRDLAMEAEPQILITSNQMAFEGFQYFVRSTLPASALRQQVREAIWRVDPEVEGVGLTALSDRLERSLISRRLIGWLLNGFGGIAMLVVLFGLASSLSATFLEMTRDLGIRSALGSPPIQLAVESVRWALLAIGVSWLLTLPISIALGRLIQLDTSPVGWDALSWVASSLVLAAIGAMAAFAPVRKAAMLDPATTLRLE